MKLLNFEIGELPKGEHYKSLHSGFKVEFHSLDEKGIKAMESFNPFCFAGLNGSGKSNVLEALASVFYHLECCVSKYKPESFNWHFKPNQCNPDAFSLEYLIGQKGKPYEFKYFDKIIVRKKFDTPPKMYRQSFPFTKSEEEIPVSLIPRDELREPRAADGKIYLPDIVVGYSSGENEILSIPFRKTRLINYDKYIDDYTKEYRYEEPENSLIYIDSNMSQAVLLACQLFENEETLRPLRKELGIVGLQSFRINLNNHDVHLRKKNKDGIRENDGDFYKILDHMDALIEFFKRSSTSWHKYVKNNNYPETYTFDYFIDSNTKRIFAENFKTAFAFFRTLQVLYELNSYVVIDDLKEDVYKTNGFYTDGKLPIGSPDENVFYFLDYLILKEIEGELEPKPLFLREFSDGEHQFLHTMGICLMLKDRRSILLLDEPETHFNPGWRAQFLKILDESIKSGFVSYNKNIQNKVHLIKDIILTSHSPFIISDCAPDNVIIFNKGLEGIVSAKRARDLGISTYGTSVNIITNKIFKNKETIGKYSLDRMNEYRRRFLEKEDVGKLIEEINEELGDSIEKLLLIKELTDKPKK